MANTIPVEQLGRTLDHDLKAIADAENAENNGMILYIRNGEIAFDTEENLFTVTPV